MRQLKALDTLFGASSAQDRDSIGVTVGLIALVLVGCLAVAESAWAVMAGFSVLYLLSFAAVLRWPRSATVISVVETVVVALVVVTLGEVGPAALYLTVSPVVACMARGFVGVLQSVAVQVAVILLAMLVLPDVSAWLLLWIACGAVVGLLVGGIDRWVGRVAQNHAAEVAQVERRYLAAEIHDGLAQELAVLAFRMDQLELQHGEEIPGSAVAEVAEELRRTMYDVRWTIHGLRDSEIPEVGLAPALAEHVRRCAEISGITAHLSISADAERLPQSVTTELLRIAQEAITNVRKHAKASNVWVSADVLGGHALLVVADDGRGVDTDRDADPLSGYGMAIMKERAERIDASFTVRSRDGGGTVVEVSRKPVRSRLSQVRLLSFSGRSADSGEDRRRLPRNAETFN